MKSKLPACFFISSALRETTDFIGTEAERVFLFVRRRGKHDNVRAERMRKFHAHMPESSETDDANLLPFANAPVAHGRVCRYPRAQQRRCSSEIQIRGDTQNEVFIDNDAVGVTAISKSTNVLIRRVEGENHVRTELLKVTLCIAGMCGPNRPCNRRRRDRPVYIS